MIYPSPKHTDSRQEILSLSNDVVKEICKVTAMSIPFAICNHIPQGEGLQPMILLSLAVGVATIAESSLSTQAKVTNLAGILFALPASCLFCQFAYS